MGIKFRPAIISDLPSISRVLVDTWRSTFTGLLPSEFLDNMSYIHQEARHRRIFELSEVYYYVATNAADEIIGFASGGPTRIHNFRQGNEIYAIYVLTTYQGKKIGTNLIRCVIDSLQSSGREGLVVIALGINPFRLFYEHLGGTKIPIEPITIGSMAVNQVAYTWSNIPSI